jgi:hypothetical protein
VSCLNSDKQIASASLDTFDQQPSLSHQIGINSNNRFWCCVNCN